MVRCPRMSPGMKFCGVLSRTDRAHYYVYFPHPHTGVRVKQATPFRRDDPQGYRKALDYAIERGKAGLAAKSHSTPELWQNWVPALIARHWTNQKSRVRADGAWKQWQAFLEQRGIPVPRALSYADIVEFVRWRSSQTKRNGDPVSKNTALCDLRIMSAIMREAVKLGYAGANPCAAPGFHRDDPAEKPEITDEEIALIRSRLPAWAEERGEVWMTNCFEVAIHQGCRLRECRVALRDIDLRRGTITFRAKGGKVFATALHQNLRPLVERLAKAGATHTCGPIPLLASKRWREFFDELELRHLCFHCTRVTVVTKLARAGIPEQQAMAYVGHSSELVHKIYQRLKPADVSAAAAAVRF